MCEYERIIESDTMEKNRHWPYFFLIWCIILVPLSIFLIYEFDTPIIVSASIIILIVVAVIGIFVAVSLVYTALFASIFMMIKKFFKKNHKSIQNNSMPDKSEQIESKK